MSQAESTDHADSTCWLDQMPELSRYLRATPHGGLRIGATRVSLETVLHAYRTGATPEGIVESFDTLTLAEVYHVIGGYLQDSAVCDRYLKDRDKQADEMQRQIELAMPSLGLRERLLARQNQAGS